jgi:hypothetical protein
VEDPSLLSLLPATIAGQAVVRDPQAFTDALADPGFVQNIETASFGVVVSGNDLVSGVVARPVAGAWSERWFGDWRGSYDEGACAVYVGTCAGGLRTYHAWIASRGLLVSAISVGDNRFGEQLMAGLRP